MVVALVGLVSAFVVLSFSPQPENTQHARQQLAQLLKQLSHKAVIEQRWYALELGASQYMAYHYQKARWQPVMEQPKDLPENLQLGLQVDQQNVQLASVSQQPQIYISPDGLFNDFVITLQLGDEPLQLRDPFLLEHSL